MRGVVLMTLAMLTIPVVDGAAKYLSAGASPLFISWARYAVASLVVLPCAAALYGARLFPTERLAAHTLRTLFHVASMTLYFFAVARIPMATALSAYFVGPILAVVLAFVLLGEKLTVWKTASLALGFAGALIILQPGAANDPGLLLAFGAGLVFAGYMIATRQAKDSDPVRTLAFQCVVGTLLLTPQAIFSWSTPEPGLLVIFAGMGFFSALSHGLSIAAFRFTDASRLAPLVYLELLGATAIGYLVFGDIPGPSTVIGAALIMAGGLLLVRR